MFASRDDQRRISPRIPVESFCSELHGDQLRHALVVDLSGDGLRLCRPLGGPRTRTLQLELEIPEMDEIVWATGEVCFDELRPAPRSAMAPTGILRTTGVRLVSAASRHRRLLRDFVFDTWMARRRAEDISGYLQGAACYMRG
ncbi:MAG TPA: PilZ domain-containing protein [Kofleriaceae bacterium]|nr:PilZ domain-containing protein [Kofleriaceae bacterium]